MSARADAARDRRWVVEGNLHLHIHLTKAANNALILITERYGLSRREVIEQLLLGQLSTDQVLVARERLSPSEAHYLPSKVSPLYNP